MKLDRIHWLVRNLIVTSPLFVYFIAFTLASKPVTSVYPWLAGFVVAASACIALMLCLPRKGKP